MTYHKDYFIEFCVIEVLSIHSSTMLLFPKYFENYVKFLLFRDYGKFYIKTLYAYIQRKNEIYILKFFLNIFILLFLFDMIIKSELN